MRAIVYIRVSTDEQADSGLGLEGQRRQVGSFLKREEIPTGPEFQDEVTGGAPLGMNVNTGKNGDRLIVETPLDKRPGLMAAIDALQKGDVLVVAKRDRLARDVFFAGMIERLVEKRGARILTADGVSNDNKPEAQMMRGILDVFAQYERAIIRSRTLAAMDVKRKRGELIGAVPYGHDLDPDGKSLVLNPTEQLTILWMAERRKSGWTYAKISGWLNETSVPSKKGSCWFAKTVRSILKRSAA